MVQNWPQSSSYLVTLGLCLSPGIEYFGELGQTGLSSSKNGQKILSTI